jgi:prepilin-type processing-associated H-X9-DG protein
MNKRREFHMLGYSSLDLLALVLAVGVVLVIGFAYARQQALTKARRINCISNQKHIGISFLMWAGDHGEKYPAQVSVTNGGVMELADQGAAFPSFLAISNELSTPKLLICPDDRNRQFVATFTALAGTNLSYFVNLDADVTAPQALHVGDRNLATNSVALKPGLATLYTNSPVSWTAELHAHRGNVGLADGSVQQVNNSNLVEFIRWSGPSLPSPGVTNGSFRLVIP